MSDLKKQNRRVAGARAQRNGGVFETAFKYQCHLRGVAATRVPDGCITVGKRILRTKTPFDFIISFQGKSAMIDTKTSGGEVLINSAIEKHQVENLMNHAINGVTAGYVVWTRKNDCIWFIEAHTLQLNIFRKGSMNLKDHAHKILGPSSKFDPRHIFYPKGVFHSE